jgi:hypothetical protein
MKHEPEQDMEKYLREFQPRAVRALEAERAIEPRVAYEVARFDWRRLAAAAVMLFALGTSIWFAHRKSAGVQEAAQQQGGLRNQIRRQELNNWQLTRLALSDKEKFDEVLTEQSRESLPNLRGEKSALWVLAQE